MKMLQLKSQGDMLLQVAEAILADCRLAYASYGREFDRDIRTLSLGYQSRGLAFFTLDLPSLDGVLTQSIESSQLSSSGPLSRRRSKADPRPRFLYALWSLVFDSNGCLKPGADPNAVFFLRSVCCLGKKIAVACSPKRLQQTLGEYHAIESTMSPPNLDWIGDDLDPISAHSQRFAGFVRQSSPITLPFGLGEDGQDCDMGSTYLAALDRVCSVLTSSLGIFDAVGDETGDVRAASNSGGRQRSESGLAGIGIWNLLKPSRSGFRHGPGAVADAGKHAFKYEFPNWPRKLQGSFPYDWCGSTAFNCEDYPSFHEPPSKLAAVPKTAKAPRLIAAEPISHQWCQQKVADWLTKKFRDDSLISKFISLNDQTKSRDLVREASSLRNLATVDLSAASDRMSCRHIEAAFRANYSVLRAFHACRTRWVVDNLSTPRKFLVLKKFAAMGSALTFPVQSLFFLCCCLAACKATTREEILALEGKVRVYGDDIIIPVEAYAGLVSILTQLGLRINESKSFSKGRFKESCGLDCFDGVDVTPLKPKTLVPDSPLSCQSLLDTSNNLFQKGLWKASAVIRSALQDAGFRFPVVGLDSGVLAYTSYCGIDLTGFKTRWNQDLQREEIKFHQLRANVTRIRKESSKCLLQYFTEVPDQLENWSSGILRNRGVTLSPRWVDVSRVHDNSSNCI